MKFPLEDNTEIPGCVKFTPCDLFGNPIGGTQIELYLPPSITFADGANYEGFDMNTQAAALDVANAPDKGASASSQADALGGASGTEISRAVIAKAAGMGLAPTELIRGGLREAPNPNTRVLFKSVALRTFQFTFKMIPTSPREAQMIANIITEFRTQLYPETTVSNGAASGTSLGYKYPDMYVIEMFWQKRSVPPKVKASFLTAVSTNLNSGSGAIFAQEGSSEYWSEIDLSLSFGEGVTLAKNDIRNGY
tara:strand:- start:2449 stop:3201 length:753 start_codon:yes stop_codon:yes gene_type:complete